MRDFNSLKRGYLGIMQGSYVPIIGVIKGDTRNPKFPRMINGHGFLIRDSVREHTKLQERPLCPLLRVP